jgi:threonine/homoserine/homoserine lactone efflux protein
MTFSAWLSLFAISLLGAMSPGPSLAMVVKHSLAGGRGNGLATAWAHSIGIGFYAFLTVVGLSVLLHQAEWLFRSISYVGAGYLAYLGWKAIRSRGGVVASLTSGTRVPVWHSAREGFLISLLNPKIAIFFTALFSQFIVVGHGVGGKAIIVITPLVTDGLWYSLITLFLSSPVILDRLKRKAAFIDRLSGLVLILLACRVVTTL